MRNYILYIPPKFYEPLLIIVLQTINEPYAISSLRLTKDFDILAIDIFLVSYRFIMSTKAIGFRFHVKSAYPHLRNLTYFIGYGIMDLQIYKYREALRTTFYKTNSY